MRISRTYKNIVLLSFIVSLLTINFNFETVSSGFSYLLLKSFFFSFFSMLLSEYLLNRTKTIKSVNFILRTLLYLGSGYFIFLIIELLVIDKTLAEVYSPIYFSGFYISPILCAAVYAFAYIIFSRLQENVIKIEQDIIKVELKKKTLENRAKENELMLLKAKIDPNFFYSSIDKAEKLILNDPKSAEDMVLNLSQFYRKQLQTSEEQYHNVEDEIAHLHNYFQLLGQETVFSCKSNLTDVKIRSGLIFNTIKQYEKPIKNISIRLESDLVQISIRPNSVKLNAIKNILGSFYSEYNVFNHDNNTIIEVPE